MRSAVVWTMTVVLCELPKRCQSCPLDCDNMIVKDHAGLVAAHAYDIGHRMDRRWAWMGMDGALAHHSSGALGRIPFPTAHISASAVRERPQAAAPQRLPQVSGRANACRHCGMRADTRCRRGMIPCLCALRTAGACCVFQNFLLWSPPSLRWLCQWVIITGPHCQPPSLLMRLSRPSQTSTPEYSGTLYHRRPVLAQGLSPLAI